jgi:hypothetical protein
MTTGTKRTTKMQRLSSGDVKPLATLIDRLALATHFPGDAEIDGADPVIRSPHHLCEASGDGSVTNRHSSRRHLAYSHRSADKYLNRYH